MRRRRADCVLCYGSECGNPRIRYESQVQRLHSPSLRSPHLTSLSGSTVWCQVACVSSAPRALDCCSVLLTVPHPATALCNQAEVVSQAKGRTVTTTHAKKMLIPCRDPARRYEEIPLYVGRPPPRQRSVTEKRDSRDVVLRPIGVDAPGNRFLDTGTSLKPAPDPAVYRVTLRAPHSVAGPNLRQPNITSRANRSCRVAVAGRGNIEARMTAAATLPCATLEVAGPPSRVRPVLAAHLHRH